MEKNYDHTEIEKKWYKFWQDNGFFKAEPDSSKTPYTVLIPPPNVTGSLHMGHVLNNTIQDIMIRYKRMCGFNALWIPGIDHAGIATQNVVEKELAKEGLTRHDVGREELLRKIWNWKEEKGGKILEELKLIGSSCDWDKVRFTMDETLSEAVKEVFVRLYEKGLIYKGKYIINWCPRCVTALANDEVNYADEEGCLWHIRYPFTDGNGYVTIATTRPETLLGDAAVAFHPHDERFSHWENRMLTLPLCDRQIPFIADSYVEKDFGSGCVKITPAHDPNDFEVGRRHNLPQLIIMDEKGIINENAPEEFRGLDRFAARKKIIARLENLGLLEKVEKHEHAVGQCYRCDTTIEPYLSDQWFVKMKPLAEKAIEVVNNGQVTFEPARWTKVYLHWMDNIRDWCISRQIWWGHRIPAYYCEDCGEMIVSKEAVTVCNKCQSTHIHQDEDVLDTWFSSWLWPFSTMGWPQKTPELEYFLPTNLLVTEAGIIYLWVARMIMSTLEFENKIPFATVYIHGKVLDEHGIKMSKSLGNYPDTLKIIKESGGDALRFGMIFNTPKGADSMYSEKLLDTGRNFANKIWNASRYILMNAETIAGDNLNPEYELADQWIYSRFNSVAKNVRESMETLRLNDAAALIMDFIWNEFCSWYLELTKERIYNRENLQAQQAVKYFLLDLLQKSMRLLHPFMPFISEEIWQNVKAFLPLNEQAVIIAAYPEVNIAMLREDIEKDMAYIQECITAVRSLRKQVNVNPGAMVDVVIKTSNEEQSLLIERYESYFTKLAKTNNLKCGTCLEKPKPAIAQVAFDSEVFLSLTGLVDITAEKKKLEKQIEKLTKEYSQITGKLKNEGFLAKAPADVVAKENEKLGEITTKLEKNKELLADL